MNEEKPVLKKIINNKKKNKYKCVMINSQDLKETSYIDGESIDEVKAYLESDGNIVLKITQVSSLLTMTIGGNKLKYSDLSFILTQLSTYLRAGIPLIDSVKILAKQSVKDEHKRMFNNIALELQKGESFSNAIASQGSAFPKLFINMVKTAELTGDLPAILDDMAGYYSSVDRTRKQAISAMTYPIIIFIFSLMVLSFILVYVIPSFTSLFESNNAELPGLTKIVLGASNYITNNILSIVVIIVGVVLGYSLLFKYIKPFRKAMQTIFMKLPIIGKLMIYNEITMFTKTFASLLSHNVFITDSIEILSKLSSNQVFSDIIKESLDYLSRGAKISESFKGKSVFPIVAYEMLVTGENTGRLPVMMEYVSNYYEDLYSNYMKRLNTFIEPLLIIFLALLVGIIILSVVVPMFSFYTTIGM